MHDQQDRNEDDDVTRLLAALPRTATLDAGEEDRLVQRLRDEGLLRRRPPWQSWAARAFAAAALFALGAFAGERHAQRNSLEEMLLRSDLNLQDRVLLLQRAGSAYVRAAESYANATSKVDSGAVEVASHVLMGAAQAIARRSLDGGLTARLSTALVPVRTTKPLIWF